MQITQFYCVCFVFSPFLVLFVPVYIKIVAPIMQKRRNFFSCWKWCIKGFIGVNCTTPNQKKIASPLHSRRDYQLIHKCKKSKIGEKQNKNNQTRRRNELFASITLNLLRQISLPSIRSRNGSNHLMSCKTKLTLVGFS